MLPWVSGIRTNDDDFGYDFYKYICNVYYADFDDRIVK